MSKEKPTLVLLSGLLCDDFVWKDIKSLLNDFVEVSVFSFAGFNSFDAMVDHVLANTPDKFALAGHSMGGRVALQLINKAPERVSHLALLNTGVHPPKESEVPGRQKLLDMATKQGMESMAKEWLPPMVGSRGLEDSELMSGLYAMIQRHTPEDFRGEIQALLNRPDAEPFLSEIKVPTLLLSSDQDNWSPISQHASMLKHLSNARLVELNDAGHMSISEAPERVAESFKEWLNL